MSEAAEWIRYGKGGHHRVEGWLMPGAIEVLATLAAQQRELQIRGPACEIGVHHGRLFILLHLLTESPERSLAIDLFEMQEENIDASGSGNRNALMQNLRTHGCDLSRITLLAENSLRLTPQRVVAECAGHPRMFSVDGGHTAEITRNDLRLAEQSVCEGALVILDDYFNSAWPAVSEGACAFMRGDRQRLVPVVITSNKFFFSTSKDAASRCRQRLIERFPDAQRSTVFGEEVVCYEPRSRTLRNVVSGSSVWRAIRKTPVGRALLQLKR